MAKSLFIFLFFSFSFLFSFRLTIQGRSVGKYYMTNVIHHDHMSGCYRVMSHDEYGKVVYRPYSNCISSI